MSDQPFLKARSDGIAAKAWCVDCEVRIRPSARGEKWATVWTLSARHAYETGHEVIVRRSERIKVLREGAPSGKMLDGRSTSYEEPPAWPQPTATSSESPA